MPVVKFPRTQHWTTGKDGFRVSVLLYNSSTDPCVMCGTRPARHSVWAEGRGALRGFTGGPARFCDTDRPERGPVPPLDYKRLVRSGDVVVYERLAPYPERPCRECGDPALFEVTTGEWWACRAHAPVPRVGEAA